jgi:hypothetical protein
VHSLGWVVARDGAELVGFVNVAWDGGVHAFVLDTIVASSAVRSGIGTRLVDAAGAGARAAARARAPEPRRGPMGETGFPHEASGAMR